MGNYKDTDKMTSNNLERFTSNFLQVVKNYITSYVSSKLTASQISYSNTSSQLSATTVQGAIDASAEPFKDIRKVIHGKTTFSSTSGTSDKLMSLNTIQNWTGFTDLDREDVCVFINTLGSTHVESPQFVENKSANTWDIFLVYNATSTTAITVYWTVIIYKKNTYLTDSRSATA